VVHKLPGGYNDNSVTVSFHYFEKGHDDGNGGFKVTGFTQGDFDGLVKSISDLPSPDLKDSKVFDGLKFGKIVPFYDLKRESERLFTGRFQSAYSGHEFENTEKGIISAKSLNLRLFCFLLYLGDDGCIYAGCQYLGNYGDYGNFSRAIIKLAGSPRLVRSQSIFSDANSFKDLIPNEVRITLSGRSASIAGGTFSKSDSIVVFRRSQKDENFSAAVKDGIFALIGQPAAVIRKGIAKILKENAIYSVQDADIQNCVVTAKTIKSRATKPIYVFGEGHRASRWDLDVELGDGGLPPLDKTIPKMVSTLQAQVLSKKLDG
jgi:hypothetical protein